MVATRFLRWTFLRAVFHRGYVLTSSLYFVITAHLSGVQLLVLGAVMALTMALSDIPAGVWSDAIGRVRPLVIGHGLLAAGMIMTGLVTTFPLLIVTQVLWGLGWAFSTGADVAWVVDELEQPARVAAVLTARARWDLVGGAAGMVALGALGWAASLQTAIVASGAAMAVLGVYVSFRFPEGTRRAHTPRRIFRSGLALARRDPEIRLVFAATMIVNGAEVTSWLFPKQLVHVGLDHDPVVWLAALGIISSALGWAALRAVQARIDGVGAARRIYAAACGIGVVGLAVLASAPGPVIGSAGVLLVGGIASTVTRAVSVIWVNRRTTTDVRATVHSFLSQAETTGEIVGGCALAGLTPAVGVPGTLMISGALLACAGAIVARRGLHAAVSNNSDSPNDSTALR